MIAIPNMNKPKSCDDCKFEGEDWGCVIIPYDWRLRTMEEVYKHCPLVEIDESEMEYLYKEFGLEKDENLTERAKELKRAILMGYLYAKTGERRADDLDGIPNDEG